MTLANSVLESNIENKKSQHPLWTHSFFLKKKKPLFYIICVCIYVYICAWEVHMSQKPGEGSRSPGTGVIGVCELPDAGAGN